MLDDQVLSVLSCRRFLTITEICKSTNVEVLDAQKQLKNLEKRCLVEHRFFAGRDYFIMDESHESVSELGKRTWNKLSQRNLAVQIGQARTCYHHLAGRAGVKLLQLLKQANLIQQLSLTQYVLTPRGKDKISYFLSESIHQSKLQTCIDFSERLPHLSGSLGNKILSQLLKDNFVTLIGNRQVEVNISLERLLKEEFLAKKSNQMFMG